MLMSAIVASPSPSRPLNQFAGKDLIAAVFFGVALCGPGHFDGLRTTSMVAMNRSISP